MSEQRRTQSPHEAESKPVENTWEDIQQSRDKRAELADREDEMWEHHGGALIDKLSVELQGAEEADRPSLEQQLEEARWSYYHSMIAATPAGEAHPNVSREFRDSFIDVAEEYRTSTRAAADRAEADWEALGGTHLDKAEAAQEKIRAQGVSAGDSEAYQRAIRNVGDAKNRVSAKWQELYGETDAAHEEDTSAKRTGATSKMGAHAASTSSDGGSSSERRKSAKAKSSPAEEAPHVVTEAEAEQEMAVQIEAYKQQGYTDATWEALQHSIGQYEAIRNDRIKREINKSIDDAYHAAAEASNTSSAEHESAGSSVSAEAAPSATDDMAAETVVIDAEAAESTSTTPAATRKGRMFTRAKRASTRLRNRLNKNKRTRARQKPAEADQPKYAEFSDKLNVEQGSLGDLVKNERLGYIPHGSDRQERDEDDSTDQKAA